MCQDSPLLEILPNIQFWNLSITVRSLSPSLYHSLLSVQHAYTHRHKDTYFSLETFYNYFVPFLLSSVFAVASYVIKATISTFTQRPVYIGILFMCSALFEYACSGGKLESNF